MDAVKATGRKQLIIAGLWTEVCVAMPVIRALGEGWDVTVITDASGGTSVEAHEVAIQRMIAAGANMMTGWHWRPNGSATGLGPSTPQS